MLMNRKLTGTAVPMERLVFSPFGVRLAGGASNGNVTVWDFGLGHPVSMAQPAGVTSLAFSPGGEILAVGLGAPAGEEPATVRLLDYPEGGLRAQFGTSAATALLYAPDQTLYAGFEDGSWARRSTMGEVTPSGDRARAAVTSLALHPAGAVLAIARRDKQVELREIATGKTLMTLTSEVPANPLFPRGVEQVEFNAAGTQVAAAFADGEILIWDCAALNPKDKPPPPVSF
jgi:WD40 repeat protein